MKLTNRGTLTGIYGLMLLGLIGAGQAAAQTTQPQTTPPATTTTPPAQGDQTTPPTDDKTTTVTVQGKKNQNRIDRQVYDNTQNIDSASGTASDALNKVPSVNVDPNGSVTLRGNSNVQVMIDGKPSAMMQGDNRAATLQSMSSGDIDSVEVMTNPGAQFGSEGTGGIINLVMKKNRRPGTSGAAIANIGSEGRYNGSLSIARNSGKMTLSGAANFRHDVRNGRGHSIVDHPLSGGGTSHTVQDSDSDSSNDSGQVTGGIDYTINDNDSVSGQFGYAHRESENHSSENYDSSIFGDYTQKVDGSSVRNDNSADIRWDHKGDQPAETLKVDLRVSSAAGDNKSHTVSNQFGVLINDGYPDYLTTSQSDTRNGVFSVDYARNIGNGQLSTGWQTTYDDNHFQNIVTGAAPYYLSTSLNSDFAYKQVLNAAYLTYQTPIGQKLVLMGGLRVEALDLTTREFNNQSHGHIYYTKANPSFFAAYNLSDTAKLRFSYSHRLQRPQAQDLNPSVVYIDSQNVTAGNANLKPQETDSYELGYEYNGATTSYQIRGYYRDNRNVITQLSTFIGNGIVLTTKANEGKGHADGLEFNYNGKIGQKLNLSLNGNLAQTELQTPSTGKTDATSLSGRINFDYQATMKDRVQFSYFSSGKQLTGQGYRAPFQMGNISYRHQFNLKTSAVVTVNDPFRSGKFKMVTDSDTVHSVITRGFGGPSVFVGLVYLLGGPSGQNGQQPGDHGNWQGGRGQWGGRDGGGQGGGGQWQGGGGPGGMMN